MQPAKTTQNQPQPSKSSQNFAEMFNLVNGYHKSSIKSSILFESYCF